MAGLAVLGSVSRTSISPQISQRIRNLTQKPGNNNYRTKATANIKQKAVNAKNTTGNGKNISRISGNKAGGGGSGKSSFKLTKAYNQSAKPLSKDVALRLNSVTKNITTQFEKKIENQMVKRGWNKDSVNSTIENPHRTVTTRDTRWKFDGTRRDYPATAYIRKDGHYIVRNDNDGTIVQISNRNKTEWKSPFE